MILFSERDGIDQEDVERPDHHISKPQRESAHAPITRRPGLSYEERPSPDGAQVIDSDRRAGQETFEAGTFVVLQLEELEETRLFGEGRNNLQRPSLVCEQNASGARPEELDTSMAE